MAGGVKDDRQIEEENAIKRKSASSLASENLASNFICATLH